MGSTRLKVEIGQLKDTMHSDSSDRVKEKSLDQKTLRRLAQNREASRKSRLRKKGIFISSSGDQSHSMSGNEVKETVASLSAKKAITKKKKRRSRDNKVKAYDLSSLLEFLPEIKARKLANTATEFKLNCRSRQDLLIRERNHLKAVLTGSAFQSNPLEFIYKHLQNTQPPVEDEPKRKSRRNGSKKAKGKRSNKFAGSESMDI